MIKMLQENRELKSKPTVEGWKVELLRIKNGERTHVIREASYEEWIDQLIEDSSDKAISEAKFLDALDQIAHSWQPAAADWQELGTMIELIAAFTPEDAYGKLFLAFESVESLDHKETPRTLLWILDALHQYYPVSPRSQGKNQDGYEPYLNLLRRCLGLAGCEQAAARRLVERDPESLLDSQVLRIIQSQPTFLTEMIDLALDTPGEALQNRRLSLLHESAVTAGKESLRRFVQAIEARDGCYEYQAKGPRLVLPRQQMGVDLKFRYDKTAKAYVIMRATDTPHYRARIIESIEQQVREFGR